MIEILHYLRFKNLSKNWEKYVLNWEKWNFEQIGHWKFCAYRRIFGIRKAPEYLYRPFDVSELTLGMYLSAGG